MLEIDKKGGPVSTTKTQKAMKDLTSVFCKIFWCTSFARRIEKSKKKPKIPIPMCGSMLNHKCYIIKLAKSRL